MMARSIDLGGRTMEVIATPGHTPDAISLLDRANGLLFTGDTYYPAPIWLLSSGDGSRCLCRVHPPTGGTGARSEVVLGAHNIPVAIAERACRS